VVVLALLLSAFAVGLDNFVAAIAIGLSGVDKRTRWRVGLVFGGFETLMPLVGLLLGHHLIGVLGQATRYCGGGLLIAAGAWILIDSQRDEDTLAIPEPGRPGRLLVAGFALSIDNLVIGIDLGVSKVPLLESVIVFGAVSVSLSLAGLEVGRRLAARVRDNAEALAGALLALVGILVLTGAL
jgi:manganese efflux pump family protein